MRPRTRTYPDGNAYPVLHRDSDRDTHDNGFVGDVHAWDFWNGDNDPSDDSGHGTAVSGVIGAVGNNAIGVTGICWQARILPIKVLPDTFLNACRNHDHIAAFADGIDYAIAMGAKVINMSFSITLFGMLEDGIPPPPREMLDAIARAEAAGVMIVVASGKVPIERWTANEVNADGLNIDEILDPNDLHPVWEELGFVIGAYPAWLRRDNILAVLQSTADDKLPAETWWSPNMGDLTAPAESVLTTVPMAEATKSRRPFYHSVSGSSAAAPAVTAAVAHLLVRHPNLSVPEIRQAILDSTDSEESASSSGLGTMYGMVALNGSAESAQGGELGASRVIVVRAAAQAPNAEPVLRVVVRLGSRGFENR